MYQRILGGAGVLLMLAACQSTDSGTDKAASGQAIRAARRPSAPVPVAPPAATVAAPDTAHFSGYRRYVGTVGTASVVLELTLGDSVRGSYYYQRRGGLLTLAAARSAAGQPLTFRETVDGRLTGRWQTRQPFGSELSGIWLSPDGRRQLPFRLREDYTGAVCYTLEDYTSAMPATAQSRECGNPADTLRFGLGVVHVLPPYPSAAIGRVARAVLPAPHAQLQRYLDQQLREEGECSQTDRSAQVTYNADGLLSVAYFEQVDGFGAHPNSGSSYRTFDLRTGRELPLAELLRAGFELPLRRLLSARLRLDPSYADFYQDAIDGDTTQIWWPAGPDGQPLAPLPKAGFYLTPAGVGFQYNPYEIGPYVMGGALIEISYHDLRPLVRPGSPLARLMQRRGLW